MDKMQFIVGKDSFEDIRISSKPNGNFYWFYHSKQGALITRFILSESPEVHHVCEVALIKKQDERFTPRIHFSVRRRKEPKSFANTRLESSEGSLLVKASVDLGECHKNFWDLISYFKSVTQLDIPDERFSLVTKDVGQIVAALRKHDSTAVKSIIQMLSTSAGLTFTEQDVNELLQRKKRLKQFQDGLTKKLPEAAWQKFFKDNKWIFGYGLDYRIVKLEEIQPNVGGTQINRQGGQIPDFMGATSGRVRFTVLVEIKTTDTPLLSGPEEVRSGAWSLSQELTDALAQTQANVDRWSEEGSKTDENRDGLEKGYIFTVKPKGIVVIGCLEELRGTRHKLQTFERFRRSIHGIEIITFDELFERARFIVGHKA